VATTTVAKRKTGWKLVDRRKPGIYKSPLAKGFRWGYYDPQLGRIVQAASKADASEKRAKSVLRKQAGAPVPESPNRLIRELGEEVRDAKRRKGLARLNEWERMLDLVLDEIGHLKPAQLGPERLARLLSDLADGEITGHPLGGASVRKAISPLNAILEKALRRGAIQVNPFTLLDEDERAPMAGGGVKRHYIWSPEDIASLIAAAESLARRPEARYDYSPIIRLMVLTGLRSGEARALRWGNVDLVVRNELRVEHSAPRVWKGKLNKTKTEAGTRDIPLSPGLVDMLIKLKPEDALDEGFVFSAKGHPDRPLGYWNLRGRGLLPALVEAGLDGKGIGLHTLRSAAISLYAARGLTMLETATVMGQSDPNVTWRHYARLFDPTKVAERVRAAQASLTTGEGGVS
jgi:integrase